LKKKESVVQKPTLSKEFLQKKKMKESEKKENNEVREDDEMYEMEKENNYQKSFEEDFLKMILNQQKIQEKKKESQIQKVNSEKSDLELYRNIIQDRNKKINEHTSENIVYIFIKNKPKIQFFNFPDNFSPNGWRAQIGYSFFLI
jgi:hypothetical protein